MKSRWLVLGSAALIFAACDGDGATQLTGATPASGDALEQYSSDITKIVKLGTNADLVQRFCKNLTGGPCKTDIAGKLEAEGFHGQGTGVDLAAAFSNMEADVLDGQPDHQSTPETFMRASYRVVLAREPDQAGALANLKFVQDTGERGQLLRAMLQSPEFRMLR